MNKLLIFWEYCRVLGLKCMLVRNNAGNFENSDSCLKFLDIPDGRGYNLWKLNKSVIRASCSEEPGVKKEKDDDRE